MDMSQRFQLFKTVADLHSQGRTVLSETEQSMIDRETMDLVRKSLLNRKAEIAPPGFDKILHELESAPDANAAYGIIVEYLKSQGELGGKTEPRSEKDLDQVAIPEKGLEKSLGGLPGEPDIMKGGPGKITPPMHEEHELPGEKHESPMHEEHESPMHEMTETHEEEHEEHGLPALKPESKPAPSEPKNRPADTEKKDKEKSESGQGEKSDKKPEPKDELKKEREALKRRAQEQEKKIEDLQKDKKDFGKEITSEEMGLEATEGTPMSSTMPQEQTNVRAKKVRMHLTKSGSIVVGHSDFGPIFHAIPSAEIRNNPEKLRLLANRIYGVAVYEGFMKAAKLCKAQMIRSAGVDEDIELNHVETVEPEKKPVTDDAENVNREQPEGEKDSITEGVEVPTREKPEVEQPSVLAAQRRAVVKSALVKMRRQGKDIMDDAENVNRDMKPTKPSGNSGDGAKTNATEQHGTPESGVLEGGDDVVRNAQKHFSKLYAARTAKAVAEAKEAFIRRFTRALRLAGTRMLLNHEEHPFKSAAVDVLADDSGSIEFSTGERFTGMDVAAAVELTELIACEGHKNFLDALLVKAADLMQKDDRYLADAESDLASLAPVSVSAGLRESKSGSRSRAISRRNAAVDGNFEVTNGAPATGPVNKTADLRGALGGSTLLGRRLERLGSGSEQ